MNEHDATKIQSSSQYDISIEITSYFELSKCALTRHFIVFYSNCNVYRCRKM